MLTDSNKTNKMIVQRSRIVGKGNSLFVQENQDNHVERNYTQATDGEMILKILGEPF